MKQFLLLSAALLCLWSQIPYASADDDGLDSSITEFDPLTRGQLKFGDKCETTRQCGFAGSICYQNYCTCSPAFMSTNHVDKCGKAVPINEKCLFNEQCEDSTPETECRDGRCICRFEKTPISKWDGSVECIEETLLKAHEAGFS